MSRREEVSTKIKSLYETVSQLTEFNASAEVINGAVNTACLALLEEIATDLATIVDKMNK